MNNFRIKRAQVETCYVIYQAQMTARWVIAMTNFVIQKARGDKVIYLPRRKS